MAMEMCWEAWHKGQDGKGKNTRNDNKCYSTEADKERYYTDEFYKGRGRIEGIGATPDQGCEMKGCPSTWSIVQQKQPIRAQTSWAAPFAPEPEQP
eukprot:9480592-Pyramimonas_sp.AAC.1